MTPLREQKAFKKYDDFGRTTTVLRCSPVIKVFFASRLNGRSPSDKNYEVLLILFY